MMPVTMRTTIRIHDDLYAQVRSRAASTGRSIGEVVEDALRAAFAQPDHPTPEVEALPTFGGSGVMPGVDLTSNAALAETMDEGVAVDALR
jgi:plasmid stability protein